MNVKLQQADGASAKAWLSAKKIAMVAAATLVAINIWTGGPLFALWVGSRVQGEGGLSMGTVGVVVLVLAAVVFVLTSALTWLNARYDELTGRPPPRRQPYPWLQSLSAERQSDIRRERGVNAVEKMVVVIVVAAILALEIWFFFFAQYARPG